jgi:zinc/manganese transport system permease protein
MTSEAIAFLAAPFVLSAVLAGIHCYLGLHVLARGVIFVDLSLAQVAAFGATIAVLFGFDHHSFEGYLFALAFTFVAAGVFALARRHEKLFPQEAVIGVTYAMASAAVVLTVDRMAHGSEHLKDMLVGQILWVTWGDVGKTALIYSIVAAIHFAFRKRFIASSFGASSGSGREPSSGLWDFLFYALFGVVITSSVQVAGVLQVFAYLIVPALVSQVVATGIRARLLFGWGLSIALSALGLFLAHRWDLPAGALMVALFTVIPIAMLLFLPVIRVRA